METLARRTFREDSPREMQTTTTSLYRLIEAIQQEVSPADDALVVEVVSHLLGSGRIRVPFSRGEGRLLDVRP